MRIANVINDKMLAFVDQKKEKTEFPISAWDSAS
jgi:hypothetical protein